MKTMKFFGKVFGLAAIIMLIGACNLPFGEDESEMENSGIDYTDYQTNAAIYVRNNTSQNLVAFAGTLDEKFNMGGIPAHQMNWGIKKNTEIFSGSKDFPMILLTEEQYLANKGNLQALKEKPFTRVYVYYNAAGENVVRYDISERLGGEYRLRVENRSNMNVELRLGGVGGETIGYAPAGMLVTTLYVTHGEMDIFPVFKRYNHVRDTVDTMVPKGSDNYAWSEARVFTDETPEQLIDIATILAAQEVSQTLGVAYLRIQNQTSSAIRLLKDGMFVTNSTGISYFQGNKTVSIDMASTDGDVTAYAQTQNISGYRLGTSGRMTPIVIKGTDNSNVSVETDKMYTVVVTGDPNIEGFKAEIDLGSAVPVTINDNL